MISNHELTKESLTSGTNFNQNEKDQNCLKRIDLEKIELRTSDGTNCLIKNQERV